MPNSGFSGSWPGQFRVECVRGNTQGCVSSLLPLTFCPLKTSPFLQQQSGEGAVICGLGGALKKEAGGGNPTSRAMEPRGLSRAPATLSPPLPVGKACGSCRGSIGEGLWASMLSRSLSPGRSSLGTQVFGLQGCDPSLGHQGLRGTEPAFISSFTVCLNGSI